MQHSLENEPVAMSVVGEIQHVLHELGVPETFQDVVSCLLFVALGAVGYIIASLLLRRRTRARVAKMPDDEKLAFSIKGSSSGVRSTSLAAKDASELMQQLRRNRRGTLGGWYASLKQEAFAVRQLVPLILSSAFLFIARSFGSTRCWQEGGEVCEVKEQTCEEIPQKKPVKEPECIPSELRQPRSKQTKVQAPARDCRSSPERQNPSKPALGATSLLASKKSEKSGATQAGKGKPTKTQVPQAPRMVAAKIDVVEQPREEDNFEKNNAFDICALRELELECQASKTQEKPLENSLPLGSAASPEAEEDGAEPECAVADVVTESQEVTVQCDMADSEDTPVTDVVPESQEITVQCNMADSEDTPVTDVVPESQEITVQCDMAESEDLCETDETREPTSGEGSTQHSADETSESGQEILSSMNEVLTETACHTASFEEVISAVQQRVTCEFEGSFRDAREFEGSFRDGPAESLFTGHDTMTSRSWPSSPSAFPEGCEGEPSAQYVAAFGPYYPGEHQEEFLNAQGDFPPGVFHQIDQFDPEQFMCSDPSEWFGDSFCPDGSVDEHAAHFIQEWGMASMGHDYDFQSVDFSHEDWLHDYVHDWSDSLNQSGFGDYFAWHEPHSHNAWMQEVQTCEQSSDHLAPAASDVCDDERHDPPPEVVTTGRTENEFIGLQLIAELGEWCAMKEQSEGGRPFFWNRSTGLRTWKMPQIMEDMGIGDHLRKYAQKVQPPSHDMPNHERQLRATRLTLGLDLKRGKEMSLRLQAMHLAMSYASQQHRPEFVARLRAKIGVEADECEQEVSMSIGQGPAQDALEGSLLHRRNNQKSKLGDESHPRSRQARRGRRVDTKWQAKEELPQRVPSPAPPPLVSEEAFPTLVGVGLAPWVAKASP